MSYKLIFNFFTGFILLILVFSPYLNSNLTSYNPIMASQTSKTYSIFPATQKISKIYNTNQSFIGLSLFTLFNLTEGMVNQHGSHLLFISNQGTIVKERQSDTLGFYDPQMINETTLMTQNLWKEEVIIWNLETNQDNSITINCPEKPHHDVIYNPNTDTFMTIGREYITTENATWEVDTIWEFDWTGEIIWEWRMTDWITNYTTSQCSISNHSHPSTVLDYSHANSIFEDSKSNIIYLNLRNLDNVWAINHTDGKVLWIAGRNGNFTMYDKNGYQKTSLWYHSHSFSAISSEPNKFILFDNNLHNETADAGRPTEIEEPSFFAGDPPGGSRMLEVKIDTKSWTMNETWSWMADSEYYSPIWGDANRLPNGNRFGCFGSRQFRGGNYTGPFPEGGLSLIETNDTNIIWQLTFEKGYSAYRAGKFQPYLNLSSPSDINVDESQTQFIRWVGSSVFKSHYQITKDEEQIINNIWQNEVIEYALPQNLRVGTHTFTLTVFDRAGQSVSDTISVVVNSNPFTTASSSCSTCTTIGFEILALLIGMVIGSLSIRKKRSFANKKH